MKRYVLLPLFLLPIYSFSQDAMKSIFEAGIREKLAEKTNLTQMAPISPLEQSVNPDEYIVGPGDGIKIIIGDQSDVVYDANISPEGTLLIPNVEAINVASMSLSEAKKRIIEKFSVKFLSRNVSVHLVQLRSFRVSVNGAVMNPGMVQVNAMNRASEALNLAGGLQQPIQVRSQSQEVLVETPSYRETRVQTSSAKGGAQLTQLSASQRNIVIKRRDGRLLRVDLQKYLRTGDLIANPYLLDGDILYVPSEEDKVGRITISGALKSPDEFEFAAGDRIKDMIMMAHGFTSDADSANIELVRFGEGSSKTTRMKLSLYPSDPDARRKALDFPLQADDRLFVRFIPKFHESRNVEIMGEVKYPGVYDISEAETHLSEIIQRAGGLTDDASLKNAYVLRRAHEDVEDPEFERLKKMLVSDMTESERQYFKIKSREKIGGMGVDFSALFERGDTSQDIMLRDRDMIYIPPQEKTVKLTGQVVNPGIYPFKPGMTMSSYLKEAGGYNWNARKGKVRIIKSNTGEWAKPKDDTIIEVGDTIFVPEKPERDWWLMTREMIVVFAQLATIYLIVERAGTK